MKPATYTFYCKECGEYTFISVEDYVNDPEPEDVECECSNIIPSYKKVAMGKHYNSRPTRKGMLNEFANKGMSKSLAHEFYRESMKGSKEAVKTGGQAYANYEFTPEICERMGAKKMTPEEYNKKSKVRLKQTVDAHKKAGIDANKKHSQG